MAYRKIELSGLITYKRTTVIGRNSRKTNRHTDQQGVGMISFSFLSHSLFELSPLLTQSKQNLILSLAVARSPNLDCAWFSLSGKTGTKGGPLSVEESSSPELCNMVCSSSTSILWESCSSRCRSRLATELISTSLCVRQSRHNRRRMIENRGKVKSDVLKYVTKNGFEYVRSANIV